MSDTQKKANRMKYIDKFRKWILAFEDDILAEKGAIVLYQSHIKKFFLEFFKIELPAPLKENFLAFDKEQTFVDATTKMLRSELGITREAATEMADRLRKIVIGPLGTRGQPQYDQSVRHITLEEQEHVSEFEKMKELLEELINYLDKAPIL